MLDLIDLPTHEPVVRPGDIVDGRYEIVSMIAQGGMGTVFLAEHVLIKRRLALKILHPSLASEASMVERFLNEAMAAGTLGHPNIVEATDMGFTTCEGQGGRIPFIVFEYLEGAMLSEEAYRLGGLTLPRALAIARQVASALETAHGAGIVHLDLKSDNVFLTDRGGVLDHVKVLDFGISRFLHCESKTTRGLVMGTPEFMAPEQIENPDEVDGRADIYALGVLLYEMLTARLPYVNTDPRILLYRICNETPPPLDRDVPVEVETMIFQRLLAKDRSQRFQTMREAEAAIAALIDQLEQQRIRDAEPPPPPGPEPPPPEPQVARRKRRWPALAMLAGLAVLAGGAGKYAEMRMQDAAIEAAFATVRTDAEHVANALETQTRTTQTRADSIAGQPLLVNALVSGPRAQVLLAELVKRGSVIPPRADEVIEVFQLRKGKLVSVLRLPANARPLDPEHQRGAHFNADNGRVITVATTPVTSKATPIGKRSESVGGTRGVKIGAVAIASPVDLSVAKQQLEQDALSATLVGLGRDIDLVRPASIVEGLPLEATLAIDPAIQTTPLALKAIVQARPRGRTFRTGSHLAFGVAGVFILGFLTIRRQRR